MTENPPSDPIFDQLKRIADGRNAEELRSFFLVLPIVDEGEALKFLTAVPAGATAEDVQRMAAEYRVTHPLAIDET